MNNFTPRAQQVLALARKEADRFNHNYVGTEHLLLGLIKLGQGVTRGMAYGPHAVAHRDGKVVFVRGAAPEQAIMEDRTTSLVRIEAQHTQDLASGCAPWRDFRRN